MSFKINGVYVQERKPDAVLAGCIEIYEKAWPVDPRTTINAIENECREPNSGVSWTKAATVGAGMYQDARTNKLIDLSITADITGNPVVQTVHNMFYTSILSTTNSYAKRYNIQESFFHEGYQLLKYTGGEHYKAHYDGDTSIGRCLSVLCYLNDDYVGGEIEFVNFGVKVKPEAGMMIVFPSNYAYAHIAHPVYEGSKYALVTWVKDRRV